MRLHMARHVRTKKCRPLGAVGGSLREQRRRSQGTNGAREHNLVNSGCSVQRRTQALLSV